MKHIDFYNQELKTKIGFKEGYYFINGREEIINIRRHRYAYADSENASGHDRRRGKRRLQARSSAAVRNNGLSIFRRTFG